MYSSTEGCIMKNVQDGGNVLSYKQRGKLDQEHDDRLIHKNKRMKSTNNKENKASAYEMMINANIAERMKFLQSLGIKEAKDDFQELVAIKPKGQNNKNKTKPNSPSERRRSMRLQNIQPMVAPNLETKGHRKGNSSVFRPEKNLPKPDPGPKNLEYYQLDDRDESTSFIQSLKDLRITNNENSIWAAESEKLKEMMNSMSLKENCIAKVTEADICSIKIHPAFDKTLVIAGSIRGQLGIWDVCSNKSEDVSNVFEYQIHSGAIKCVTVDSYNPLRVYTSSYDGSLRMLDLETSIMEELYCSKVDCHLSCHVQKDANTFLVANSFGIVDCVDTRASKRLVKRYKLLSSKRVKVVALHPTQNYTMATTNYTIENVFLWDLRNIKSPVAEMEHPRTVNGIEFSPVTGKHLLTTCFDNKIRVLDATSSSLKVTKKINHFNRTGRGLTTFRASWLPGNDDHFVVGSLDLPKNIGIGHRDGSIIHRFTSVKLMSVGSANSFHPHKKVLAAGYSSGKVYVFRDETI